MGEEEGKLSYSAEMDDSAFVRGMNNIRESVHETANEVKQTGMTVDEFTGEMNKLLGSFEKMTAAVNRNTAAQEQVARAGKKAGEEEQRGAEKATEAIQKTTTATKELGTEFEQSSGMMTQGMDKLTKAAAGFLTLQASKDFVLKVTSIRGEFQKLEVAFNTMLGSEERAQQLMQQLTQTAAITPFDLKGVADGAKQLLAYGVAAEDVNDTLIHLGDIAAGLSIPLNDIVMLYGTTMTQGRMFTQDLRQFMGRGIPLADELAKQFGVTKDKVQELVTAGKVGAEEFNKAIMSMSSEGGKFAGLMEAQSHTIAGQISNIEDAIDTMFNEIGKSNEGINNDVLGSVSYLVENYKKVGAVLMDAVVAIGLYKTALITAHAIEKTSIAIKQAMAVQEALLTAEAKKLAAARGISVAAARAELGSVNVLTVAKMRLTAATKALTASMMANPYTAVAVAIAAVAFGVYKLATAEGVETAARRRANEEMQTFADKLDEQQNKIKRYIQTIQDETATEYQKAVAWEMLNKMAPTLTEKYDKAAIATLDLAEATKELGEQADKANYEHIRDEVQKWKETIDRINQNMLDDARDTGGKNAIFNLQQLKGAETQLDTYLTKLVEIDRIRAKMAEDAKPIEIRIKEANENIQAKQEIYDFYKRAADLAGELKKAHDEAADAIANSGIPYNYEAIADKTKEKYDALIAELEADVEDLRTRIAESPASLELEQELKGKEKALNDLISTKQQWALSGATTIPLNFVMNFSQVETALQNAKNGQGINTKGMRFNAPTGTWVKDEATAPKTHTAAQWRKDAYNNWKQAQAAVEAFWNKKEEMDKATFDTEYDRLKGIADKAKKDYDKLKGSTNGHSSAARKAAETARKHQAYLDLIEKQRVEQERAVTDMEFSTEQATIDAMQDGAEKTLRQLKLDHEKRKEEIEREYADLKQAKIDAAKQLFEANPANNGKVFDASSVDTSYSEKEQANYKALMASINATYRRALEDRQRMEAQAMLDYLKEYGSIQQQKYAIEREYNEKIAKEEDEWRKKQLEAEKNSRLSQMSAQNIAANIDWKETFKGVGNILEDIAKESLKKVEEYMKTAEFKALSAQDKQAYADLRTQLIDASGTSASNPFSKKTWDDIAAAAQRYRTAVKTLNDANEHAEEVRKRLTAAEEEAANNPADARLQEVVDGLREQFNEAGETVKSAETEVTNAQSDLRVKTDNVSKGFQNFDTVLGQITSGSLSGFALAVGNIIKKISGDTDKVATDFGALFGEAGKQIGGLVGAILQIIDILGTEPTKFIDDILTKVADVLEAVLSQLPEIIAAAIKGVGNIVGGIGKGILGMVGLDIFGSDNHEEMLARQQSYNRAIDSSTRALDRFTSELERSYGAMAVTNAKEAEDIIRRNMESIVKGIDSVLEDNYGGGHSEYYHLNKNQNVLQQIAAYGSRYGINAYEGDRYTWQALLQNDPEKLAKMFKEIAESGDDLWRTITTQLGYNEGALQEWIEKLIDTYDQIEENNDKLKEQLTTTTAENVFDDFRNSLYDFADGSEDAMDDIASNWQKMVNRMVINNLVFGQFEEDLKRWYDALADLNQRSSNMEHDEYQRELQILYDRYTDMVNSAQQQMSDLTEAGIIKRLTESTKTYFEDLRSTILDTLMDVESDVEGFKKSLNEKLANDFIESQVLNVPITVGGSTFEDFNAYAKDWNNRYADAVTSGNMELMQALMDELVEVREDLISRTAEIRETLKDKISEDETFKGMTDSWASSLMDMNKTAEDWAEEIGRTMAQKIMSEMVAPTMMQPLLDRLQDVFNSAIGADGATWQTVMTDGGVRAALQAITDAYPDVQATAKELMEALGVSFEEEAGKKSNDIAGSIVSLLQDTSKDIEQVGKEIAQTLMKRMIEEIAQKKYEDELTKVNTLWESALEQGDATALENVRKEILSLYETIGNDESVKGLIADLKELDKQTEEGTTPFDNFRDSFKSALMDVRKSAKDFVKEINEMIADAFVDKFVMGDAFDEKLAQWKKRYSDIIGNTGMNEQQRLQQLKELGLLISSERDSMTKQTRDIMSLFGLNNSEDQGASMNMAEAATYDQFEMYLGIATAQQMNGESQLQVQRQILSTLEAMNDITSHSDGYGQQIFNRLGATNEYLLAIKSSNQAIYEAFSRKLDLINANLQRL